VILKNGKTKKTNKMEMLKNNSKEMKTVVETFVIEETQELIYDNEKLENWNRLVEELGLKGQETIISPEKSPIPFLHINTQLSNTFETLCPRKVLVEEYSITPIPVEILSLISLSKKENYFDKIEIWYDDKTPDPVCIGFKGYFYEIDWYSNSNQALKGMQFKTKQEVLDAGGKNPLFREEAKYLIGKWGDVKHTFSELKKMATKRFKAENINDLQKRIKDAQRDIDDLETKAFDRFGA
jgi:hypothetical protein